MPYLDTALAFALTMLAVSTLVTSIVHLLQNAAKLRRSVMREMLNDYFTKELKPIIERELNRLQNLVNDTLAAELKILADKLAVVLPPIEKKLPASGGQPPAANHPLFTKEELKGLVDLSMQEIVERLKRSEMGAKLLKELGDKAEPVFDELGKRYEIVGEKFTKSFREHSRTWAMVVATFLAFILNIDSIFIVNTYLNNEGMRQAVIAQKETLQEGYQTIAEKFEQDQNKTEISKAEFEQAFSDSKQQLDFFTRAGFPIGWSYFPHACLKAPEQIPAAVTCTGKDIALQWITWVLGCFLTGALAGLGGPFWYDVVTGISRAVQSARNSKKTDAVLQERS